MERNFRRETLVRLAKLVAGPISAGLAKQLGLQRNRTVNWAQNEAAQGGVHIYQLYGSPQEKDVRRQHQDALAALPEVWRASGL
jgi:hypothetical protein